ncbi:MAG: hydroxypyruvate isomerase [Betaproteobacteria bacterium]|nr:MAG: hydroxypyruvate isomerase [Betaproteobacteria bacterium]
MPKLNANLSMMFNEVEFADRFDAAARAGFKGVEFLFPYGFEKNLLQEKIQSNQLEMVLFNMPPGDWDAGDRGMACDPLRSGEFQDNVAQAIDYALALNCKQLHCMAGLKPRGVSEEQMREAYLANLRFAGKELAKHNITLLIEAINSRDIPGFYLNYSAQAFDIMHYAHVPNLAFQYDIYHMQIMEGDLAPTIEKHLSKIGHMQLADTPGRHEPGSGEVNYPFLLDFIDRIGYKGWIGCEYRPAGNTEDGLSWARQYL